MIVKWPGKIHGGVVNDTVWTFTDVLPTLLEVAGKPAPKGLDGVSLLPTLLGQSQDLAQRFLYWEFHERGFKQAARWGPWKAIRLGFGQPLQLFHLEDDIGESHDVANRYPEVVEKLTFSSITNGQNRLTGRHSAHDHGTQSLKVSLTFVRLFLPPRHTPGGCGPRQRPMRPRASNARNRVL